MNNVDKDRGLQKDGDGRVAMVVLETKVVVVRFGLGFLFPVVSR